MFSCRFLSSMTVGVVLLALSFVGSAFSQSFAPIRIPTKYQHHLQGFCLDDEVLYLSFTSVMVKADFAGKVLLEVPIASHAGDICLHDGLIYVAHDVRSRNQRAGYYITVLDTDFQEQKRVPLTQTVRPGSITFMNGDFYVGDGQFGKEVHTINYVHQYDQKFNLRKVHTLDIGTTKYGVQTMAPFNEELWMGFYMSPAKYGICRFDAKVNFVQGFDKPNASVGLSEVPKAWKGQKPRMIVAANTSERKNDKRIFGAILRFYEFDGEKLLPLEQQQPQQQPKDEPKK